MNYGFTIIKTIEMKYLTIVFIVALFACSYNSKRNNVKGKIASRKNNTFLCLSIVNNTNRKIYIPEIRGLGGGLKIYAFEKNQSYIDYTNEFITLGIKGFENCDYEIVEKCCKPMSVNDFLSHAEIDSIATSIVENSQNGNPHLYNRIVDLLNDIAFIEPKRSFNDYFPISDSVKYKKIAIKYSYPYPYPVIRTGPYGLSEKEIENNKKILDSLHFKYPKYIKGYELYNEPIFSDSILVVKK